MTFYDSQAAEVEKSSGPKVHDRTMTFYDSQAAEVERILEKRQKNQTRRVNVAIDESPNGSTGCAITAHSPAAAEGS
jgi:hypothetical protein